MASETAIYLVPLIDVNWENFAPLLREKGFLAEQPPLELCAEDIAATVPEFRDLTDGRVVYTVHSGTYCRTAFYEEPFLESYRSAVAQGAEVSVHTHEEIAGEGTRNHNRTHMETVIRARARDLRAAGLAPNSYRGGHFAYMEYLTPILESEDLVVDFSCAPGFDEPWWDAVWSGAPYSSYYLCPDDRTDTDCSRPSSVLEVPLGADGQGASPRNFLYVEESTDEDLRRVWDTIVARPAAAGRPQIVHMLYHSSSMHRPEMVERLRRLVDHMARHGAQFVNATEARSRHDEVVRG